MLENFAKNCRETVVVVVRTGIGVGIAVFLVDDFKSKNFHYPTVVYVHRSAGKANVS
jgi:hypothetical protein